MVVGPNGTGKSTILCAICLGLGGEPRLLGRASEVETFVQNGQDVSEIEIELKSEKGENAIIRRIIRRNNVSKQNPKSSFFLHGIATTGKKIREMVLQDYSISVDNLCTFLPQDRVGSFSGFDSKALLIETEKSLSASQHLYHTHLQLIQAQQELASGHNNVSTLQEKLEKLKTENERLEREKKRMGKQTNQTNKLPYYPKYN
jgi:chromosome segregation ATPase